jgi:hypothetical protein
MKAMQVKVGATEARLPVNVHFRFPQLGRTLLFSTNNLNTGYNEFVASAIV